MKSVAGGEDGVCLMLEQGLREEKAEHAGEEETHTR